MKLVYNLNMKGMNIFMKKSVFIIIVSTLLLLSCIGIIYCSRSFKQEKLSRESKLQKMNEAYNGRNNFFNVEYDGYFSHLLIFPENNMESMHVEVYNYDHKSAFFDEEYTIILKYTLNAKEYEQEKQRLSKIHMCYKDKQQNILELEYSDTLAFFVASWSENRAYEYAIADDTEQTIICIYTQLKRPDEVALASEYMIEELEVLEEIPEKFSIYYFKTGNESYVLPELSGHGIKSTVIGL